MPALKQTPTWQRAETRGAIGVDRESKIVRGYVVAERGIFKDQRGEFDDSSLGQIVALMRQKSAGLKSRFTHPTLSSDGLGTFLGRAKNPRMEGGKVRADLHLDPTSFATPNGNLGQYIMDLADSDPDAFASSLVLQADKNYRLDAKGRPVRDTNGEELPPLWFPTRLHATDVVDTGAAVSSFLSSDTLDRLPDAVVRQGVELLDRQFGGQPAGIIRARVNGWLDRYLAARLDDDADDPQRQADAERFRRLQATFDEVRRYRVERMLKQGDDRRIADARRSMENARRMIAGRDDHQGPRCLGVTIHGRALPFHRTAHDETHTHFCCDAFSQSLASGRTIRALLNHDATKELGDTREGSLRVWQDERWVWFSLRPRDTALGREVVEKVRAGKIGVSIGYSELAGHNGHHDLDPRHLITEAELGEISLTEDPAYPETSAWIA